MRVPGSSPVATMRPASIHAAVPPLTPYAHVDVPASSVDGSAAGAPADQLDQARPKRVGCDEQLGVLDVAGVAGALLVGGRYDPEAWHSGVEAVEPVTHLLAA